MATFNQAPGAQLRRPRCSSRLTSLLQVAGTAALAIATSAQAAPEYAMVANHGTDSVTVFDMNTDTVVGSVAAGAGEVLDCSIPVPGTRGYVGNFNGGIVAVDLATASLASGTNPIPSSIPTEDTSTTADGRFLVSCDGGTTHPVSVLDTVSRTEVDTLTLSGGCQSVEVCTDGSVLAGSISPGILHRLTIDGAGNLTDTGETLALPSVFNSACGTGAVTGLALNQSGTLQSFSIPGLTPITTRTLGAGGYAAVVSGGGTRIAVRTSSAVEIYDYDSGTGAIGAAPLVTIPTPGLGGYYGVDQLALNRAASKVYVSSATSVKVYDTVSGALLSTISDPSIVDATGLCTLSGCPASEGDADGDLVYGVCDNCPSNANSGQADCDHDGVGDACDPDSSDTDSDGIDDACDNCAGVANAGQEDTCAPSPEGDACDADTDSDTIFDACDNCAAVANTDQADTCARSLVGDACDPDGDSDGVSDACDNCASVANPGQEDFELLAVFDPAHDFTDSLSYGASVDVSGPFLGDGVEFSCGTCDVATFEDAVTTIGTGIPLCGHSSQVPREIIQDGDILCARITGTDLLFPVDLASHRSGSGTCFDADSGASCTAAGGYSSYLRGDGFGDACDGCVGDGAADADGDLLCDLDDNCVSVVNAGQDDTDGDRVGDACDNCVDVMNVTQIDSDDDGLGNACDDDDDDDGVLDGTDNCPLAANSDQADLDSDGVGNSCDNCPADANPAQNQSVADVLDALEASYLDITALVPDRYDFSEGATGSFINDGGDDMYDDGNVLNTNLAAGIPYTDKAIVASDAQFGPGSEYFTAKYPGLFFLAVSNLGIDSFSITGDNGADGSGSVDAVVLSTTSAGFTFTAYVKRVFSAGDPSINHMIIVPGDGSGVSHSFSLDTNNDLHTVTGLTGVSELYYVLVARDAGQKLSDADAQAILDALAPSLMGAQADADGDGEGDVCDQCPTLEGTGACDDGLFCTVGDTCGGGSCNASPRVCDDSDLCTSDSCSEGMDTCVYTSTAASCVDADPCTQDSCVPATGCVYAQEPATTCLAPVQAKFQIGDSSDDTKDQLKWSWNKGPGLTQADFGSPGTTTTYTLCVYDTTGGTSSIEARLEIAAGPSWTSKDPKGWNYKDKSGASDGVVKVQLGSGATGRSKIKLQAKGTAIPMPAPFSATEHFDQSPSVTVQLYNDATPVCWTSQFLTASKNTAAKFSAKF